MPSTSRAIFCRCHEHFACEIVNARTLETQVSHLLSDPHKEVRDLADLMKKAASSPAYNANHESLRELVRKIREVDADLGEHAEAELLREVRVAPTLVKYADPNTYEVETNGANCAKPLQSHERRANRGRACG